MATEAHWWIIHVRDRVAQRVTAEAECCAGCIKVYAEDWRKAFCEYLRNVTAGK